MSVFRRPVPALEPETEAFWRACRAGRLEFRRCVACNYFVHPPRPVCPRCRGRELAPTPVSGRGRVFSYTINYQAWFPGQAVPYAIALVEIEEQPGLRLTTNIVNCPLDRIDVGMRVRVVFENLTDEVAVPLFEPEDRP